MKLLWLIGLMLANMTILLRQASADVYGRFGLAVAYPERQVFESGSKNLGFGYAGALHWGRWQAELGAWDDNTDYPGARASLYVQTSLGLEPDLPYIYANYHVGPAFLQKNDTLLGSHVEIYQELGAGLKDYRGIRLGLHYWHMSNAGAWGRYNKGRNYIGLRLQF